MATPRSQAWLLAVTAATVATAAVGCAAIPRPIEDPTITVRAVEITNVGFSGIRGAVQLELYNPNGFGVPVRSGTWELAVGSATAVRGRFELTETIPAKAAAPVRVELSISAADAVLVAAELSRGQRQYTIHGTLEFSTSLGSVTVGYDHSDQLVLPD